MIYSTYRHFAAAAVHARRKHPKWVRSRLHYTAVLLEEVAEHLWHVWRGRTLKADNEGTHVAAVIIRGIEEGYGS
ncbi:MAG: hypothetical protein LBR82_00190 [Desulfovibrio sp.]|jgi:hypothetical protein|nr:hypothetical protein [Desulfovibrio sp.]